MQKINWYPGHMNKAKNQIGERLSLVDVVIEVLDARVPESSRNPVVAKLTENKPKVIVLNKSDLADPKLTKRWKNHYENETTVVVSLDSKHNSKLPELLKAIKQASAAKIEKLTQKGVVNPIIRAICVGIPNCGKSTILNRLVGKNVAVVGNKPGVTKNQNWLKVNQQIELLDTPGILWPKFEDPKVGMKLAAIGSIKETVFQFDDVALFLLDYLHAFYPKQLDKYLNTIEFDDNLPELLMSMAQKFGFREDYDRYSYHFIQQVRKLKLGQFTFDFLTEVDHKNDN